MALRRYIPSQADVAVFKGISAAPDATAFPSVARWYSHIKSYEPEFGSLSGSSTAGDAFLGVAAAPAAAAPAAEKKEDDDEDIDLFGSDDEEDAEAERIKAERVAAYNAKKAAKPKTVAKVRPLLHLSRFSAVMCCVACIYDLSEYDVDLPRPVVRCHLRSEALG